MEDPALLLETDACWTQVAGSVDHIFVEAWGEYQGELLAIKISVRRTFLEIVKIGHELAPASVLLEARLE